MPRACGHEAVMGDSSWAFYAEIKFGVELDFMCLKGLSQWFLSAEDPVASFCAGVAA